jgi:hypothetical protein
LWCGRYEHIQLLDIELEDRMIAKIVKLAAMIALAGHFCAVGAQNLAYTPPDRIGGYQFDGTNWSALVATGTTGAVPTPPAVGLYGLNAQNQWVPCGINPCMGGAASSVPFPGVTTGTNNGGNTLTVGSTSSLTFSGTGIVNANQINGAAFPTAQTLTGSNAGGQPTSSGVYYAAPATFNQTFINAVMAAGGGRIILAPGTYTGNYVLDNASGVCANVDGSGIGVTNIVSASSSAAISYPNSVAAQGTCELADVYVDGAYLSTSGVVNIQSSNVRIHDIQVDHAPSGDDGIVAGVASGGNGVIAVNLDNIFCPYLATDYNAHYGSIATTVFPNTCVHLLATATDGNLSNIGARNLQKAGIQDQAGLNKYTGGFHFYGFPLNISLPLYGIETSGRITVVGAEFDTWCGAAIHLIGNYMNVSDSLFQQQAGNTCSGSAPTTAPIFVDGAFTYVTVENNSVTTNNAQPVAQMVNFNGSATVPTHSNVYGNEGFYASGNYTFGNTFGGPVTAQGVTSSTTVTTPTIISPTGSQLSVESASGQQIAFCPGTTCNVAMTTAGILFPVTTGGGGIGSASHVFGQGYFTSLNGVTQTETVTGATPALSGSTAKSTVNVTANVTSWTIGSGLYDGQQKEIVWRENATGGWTVSGAPANVGGTSNPFPATTANTCSTFVLQWQSSTVGTPIWLQVSAGSVNIACP